MRNERVYIALIHTDPETMQETRVWQGWGTASKIGYTTDPPLMIMKHPINEYKWRRLPESGPHAFH